MKFRSGFVSNSSSSSFVLVTTSEDYNDALSKLSDKEKYFMDRVSRYKGGDFTNGNVGDTDVIVISGGDYEDSWSRGDMHISTCDIEYEDGVDVYEEIQKMLEPWGRFIDNLPKDKIIYKWSNR